MLSGKDNYLFTSAHYVESLLGDSLKVKKEKVLLINTSYDKTMISFNDAQGSGSIDITDRLKLTKLFKKLKVLEKHEYIIVDVFFEHKTIYDDSLIASLKSLDDVIIASKESMLSNNNSFMDINYGLAETEVLNSFYKYKLYVNSNKLIKKSIPLKLYESFVNDTIKPGAFFGRLNGQFILNDYVPKFYVTRRNAFVKDEYQYINLNDLIEQEGLLDELTEANPAIVIGDFNNDIISTSIEPNMPGSLVLLNTVISLKEGVNSFSFFWFVVIYIVFFFFSYLVIPKPKKENSESFWLNLLKKVFTLTGYTFLMIVFSILVILIFDTYINLALIGLIFYFEMFLFQKIKYLRKLFFKID